MLQLIQQLTGINTVMYYCGTIFTLAGFTDPTLAIWLTAAVSFVGWVCCFGGVLAVERAGRRKLTLASLAGVVVALLALGGGFFYSERTSPHALPHGPAAGANGTGGGSGGGCQAYRSCFDCVVDSGCGFCGPAGGGFEVTFRGTNFVEGMRVFFGGAEAQEVIVVSPAEFRVTAPTALEPLPADQVVDVRIVPPEGDEVVVEDAIEYEGNLGDFFVRGDANWDQVLDISDGLHTREDIPVKLGEPEKRVQQRLNNGQPTWVNPTERQGKRVWYSASIGTEPFVAEVILERVREAASG